MVMGRLSGSFTLVGRKDRSTIVVGCLGGLSAENLTANELKYIASWYNGGFPSRVDVLESEVLETYQCRNSGNYSSFVQIKTA